MNTPMMAEHLQTQEICVYDNRSVILHNHYLLAKYNRHINVEVCASIKVVKYILIYIYKGPDQATLEVRNVDEMKQYIHLRYIGPVEACWHILEFSRHLKFPAIYCLPIHIKMYKWFTSILKTTLWRLQIDKAWQRPTYRMIYCQSRSSMHCSWCSTVYLSRVPTAHGLAQIRTEMKAMATRMCNWLDVLCSSKWRGMLPSLNPF